MCTIMLVPSYIYSDWRKKYQSTDMVPWRTLETISTIWKAPRRGKSLPRPWTFASGSRKKRHEAWKMVERWQHDEDGEKRWQREDGTERIEAGSIEVYLSCDHDRFEFQMVYISLQSYLLHHLRKWYPIKLPVA